ncbi:cache domain-containing sensor histidine kinase [Domibacillus indicus]|uniref:cache domain-containing sensor histidine kinase n=1 Tax=Domibacillus indicus TaxID=1437523 RepID=UPI000617FC91|nr:sensor histidine kinase [Domibacillus indicus]
MKWRKKILSSLRAKLLLMFIFLTIVPLTIVGVISYMKFNYVISEHSSTLAQMQIEQVKREYDNVLQDIKRLTEIGKKESTVQFLIDQKNTAEEARNILGMINLYKENYQYSENVMNIKIMGLDGKAISEDRGVYQLENEALNQEVYAKLLKQPEETIIDSAYKNSTPALSMTSTIISDDSEEVIGFLNIIIKASIFKNILSEATQSAPGNFYVETENGDILFTSPELAKTTQTFSRDIIEENHSGYFTEKTLFTVFQTSDLTGWKFIRSVPVSHIMKESTDYKNFLIVMISSGIIILIMLYYFFSSKLILPLRSLKTKMSQASSGNLDIKVTNKGYDEIAELGHNFNHMITKIKSLLETSVNKEKQLKMAELRTLQTQINPHFLYNTLETIIWMAEAGKGRQVVDITKALSHFFRISLSKGRDVILLKSEIEHIRNYLFIQKIRYQDILDVSFHLNEDILHFEIVKLTLQPLVENAIYHGIKNRRGKGFVRIKGDFTPEGYICIDIIDNGVGITENKLIEIRNQLSAGAPFHKTQGGFGMVNVHQRIRLHYGEPFGLKVNSWYGSGTRVSLLIPAKR